MRREIYWEKTSSFPQKTYTLTENGNPFGYINQQFDYGITYISEFKNRKYLLSKLKLVDLNANKIQLAEFLDTSFDEYIIRTETSKYIYNRLSKEVLSLNGKTYITIENESMFFSKQGKIIVFIDVDVELLISSLFYLKHVESNIIY